MQNAGKGRWKSRWIFLNTRRRAGRRRRLPLAARMRPQTLDEVVGKENIIGKDKLLYQKVRLRQTGSARLSFYGLPGVGKTTLARVIANTTHPLISIR